jgi:hypothetical protein
MCYDKIYEWSIHTDTDNSEYIRGYRNNSYNMFETSNIKYKIPMSTFLLIVTENDSIYHLPYYSCY